MAWFPQQKVESLKKSVGLVCQALWTALCQCSLVPHPSQAGVWVGIWLSYPLTLWSCGACPSLGIRPFLWSVRAFGAQGFGRCLVHDTQHQYLQNCWQETPDHKPPFHSLGAFSFSFPVMRMKLLKQCGLASLPLTLPCGMTSETGPWNFLVCSCYETHAYRLLCIGLSDTVCLG